MVSYDKINLKVVLYVIFVFEFSELIIKRFFFKICLLFEFLMLRSKDLELFFFFIFLI